MNTYPTTKEELLAILDECIDIIRSINGQLDEAEAFMGMAQKRAA